MNSIHVQNSRENATLCTQRRAKPELIQLVRNFNVHNYHQKNLVKTQHCVYKGAQQTSAGTTSTRRLSSSLFWESCTCPSLPICPCLYCILKRLFSQLLKIPVKTRQKCSKMMAASPTNSAGTTAQTSPVLLNQNNGNTDQYSGLVDNRCCFCLTLRTGAIITGVLNGIINVALFTA